jgi:hypothetical protein
MFMMLGPLGSISGAILGAVIGAKQSSYMGRPKLIGIVLLTYLLCASILYSDNGQQLAIAYCLGSVFILVAALGKPVPWLGMMSLLMP